MKKNRLVSITVCVFMALSAAFIGLTVMLFASLLGSVDKLMTDAKTCDFLQMHSGDIDREELKAFADTREDVEDILIGSFLNMDNSVISLNGRLLTDSTQDNGFCVQNENFDYMLGMENEILEPEEGKVYVPVCYKNEYDLEEDLGKYENDNTTNDCELESPGNNDMPINVNEVKPINKGQYNLFLNIDRKINSCRIGIFLDAYTSGISFKRSLTQCELVF